MTSSSSDKIATFSSKMDPVKGLIDCQSERKEIETRYRRDLYRNLAHVIGHARTLKKSKEARTKFYGLGFWDGKPPPYKEESILLHALRFTMSVKETSGSDYDLACNHNSALKKIFESKAAVNDIPAKIKAAGGLEALRAKQAARPDKTGTSDDNNGSDSAARTSSSDDDSSISSDEPIAPIVTDICIGANAVQFTRLMSMKKGDSLTLVISRVEKRKKAKRSKEWVELAITEIKRNQKT